MIRSADYAGLFPILCNFAKKDTAEKVALFFERGTLVKVLIAYLSQTGNTEKIAIGISEAVADGNEVILKRIKGYDVKGIENTDLIFIGSPLHSGKIVRPILEFLEGINRAMTDRIAFFITHFAPAYPKQTMEQFKEPILAVCKQNKLEYMGCFTCQGALVESLHPMVQKKLEIDDEGWADIVTQMQGHPNSKDIADAQEFARNVLSSISGKVTMRGC